MSEPIDVILPILRGIQEDIADMKRRLGRLDTIDATLSEQAGRITEMNGYLALSLNTQMRHTDEIDSLRSAVKALTQRVSALEAAQH